MINNSQVQTLKQHLKVNPQQIQFLNFLNLGLDELDDFIKKELEENPFLEEDNSTKNDLKEEVSEPDSPESTSMNDVDWESHFSPEEYDYGMPQYDVRNNNYSEDDSYSAPVVVEYTFRDEAKEQIHYLNFTEKQLLIAEYLVDMLDDTGFLRRSIEDLTDDISFSYNVFVTEEEVMKVKNVLNQLENGLASIDLRECLLLQLADFRKQGQNVDVAYNILHDCFKEFSEREFEKIASKLSIAQDDIKQAIALIATLSPSPVRGKNSSTVRQNNSIIPDYIIELVNDQVIGRLNNPRSRHFGVNNRYADELSAHKDRQTRSYVGNKVKSAMWFIDAIQQRQLTMTKAINALVYLQEPYFRTGKTEYLRPMILKDVADLIGMEISTVSRVTSKKYAQSPFGIIHLKKLFSDSIQATNGSEVSNRQVKELVKKIIEEEDKNDPLTDTAIKKILEKDGLVLSRRTITKYREAMNISASKYRRTL